MRSGLGRLSLAQRIVLSVAFGLALILVLFGVVASWTIHQSADAAYGERVTLAQALASRVDDVLSYRLAALEREAANLRMEPGLRLTDVQRKELADLHSRMGSFTVLSVTDADGIAVWSDSDDADVELGKPVGHASVRAALNTGQSRITEFVSASSRVYASLAVPLFSTSGRVVGALMAELDPSHPALSLLPTGEVGNGVQAQLLNTSGEFLAGTSGYNPRFATEHLVLLDDLVVEQGAGYRMHEPRRAGTFPSHVVAWAPVSLLPLWGVTVEQPRDAVLELPLRLQQQLALFGFAALLLAAAVAWFDVHRVVRPLKRLTMAAERFAAGQLDVPVQLERADELGVLARAFETMRQRLRASLAEVAEWNRSALVEPDRVITLVVQKARDLVNADVAGLALVEEGAATITWRLLMGSSDRARQIRLGPGEGIAGRVVQTGLPLVVPDWELLQPGEGASAPIVDVEGLRSCLAVPLQSGGHAFGALMVANRRPTLFDDDQLKLLSSLADQAAVALDNARLYRKVQSLAVLEERERIAREMHDGLGQVLGYVNTKTLAVGRLLEVGKVDDARVQLRQLETAAKEVYADVREAILGLRTVVRPGKGLLTALREYLEGFELQSGITVELRLWPTECELRLPLEAEIQLLRIIQEALANIRKHAGARCATVQLTRLDDAVRLVVEDDGVGFDRERVSQDGWPRFGLQTMQERAASIGATFAIESLAGAGTRIILSIAQDELEEADHAVDARPVGR